jgi:hypothetical protein
MEYNRWVHDLIDTLTLAFAECSMKNVATWVGAGRHWEVAT